MNECDCGLCKGYNSTEAYRPHVLESQDCWCVAHLLGENRVQCHIGWIYGFKEER